MSTIEKTIEYLMFRSRWLLAPMYMGLTGGLLLMTIKFCQEFLHIFKNIINASQSEVVLSILDLVDFTLVANLLLMVVFSGYENFVSKIDVEDHEDRPEWMGKVGYSGLKLKLIGSIVAISAIDLLKAFMNQSISNSEHLTDTQLAWMLGIHFTLILSGVLFAMMDKIAASSKH